MTLHRNFQSLLAAIVLVLVPAHSAAADDDGRTMKLDVVELLDHQRHVEGAADIALVHEDFTYLFSNWANMKTFQREPARYEIQLDGACARMGALSGRGRAQYWATHKDKLYIFASEACRDTFKTSPDRMLDGPDPIPKGNEVDRDLGRQMIDFAVKGVGGAERLDGVVTMRATRRWSDNEHGEAKRLEAWTHRFPDSVRRDSHWDDWTWAVVATPEAGWEILKDSAEPLGRVGRRTLELQGRRHVLAILRARKRGDFVAIALEPADVVLPDGTMTRVDRVAAAFDETTTILGIDQATGQVLMTEYVGRGPSLFRGTLQTTFGDFRPVGGLMLPHAAAVRFEGKLVESESGSFEFEVDQAAHLDLFSKPNMQPQEAQTASPDAT